MPNPTPPDEELKGLVQQIELKSQIALHKSMADGSPKHHEEFFKWAIGAIHDREAKAERRGRIELGREYWLLVHDILRDKGTKTIGIQEAIDVASKAYEIFAGESIQKWFDELAQSEQEGSDV